MPMAVPATDLFMNNSALLCPNGGISPLIKSLYTQSRSQVCVHLYVLIYI